MKIVLSLMMLFLSACQQLYIAKPLDEKLAVFNTENSLNAASLHNNSTGNDATLVQQVDNFLVIVDSSSSVNDDYLKSKAFGLPISSKFFIGKELLRRFNDAIPTSLRLLSSIRKFGHGECLAWQETMPIQSLSSYTKLGFAEKTAALGCAGGGSPAASALRDIKADLASAKGNIAIIFVSDGNYSLDLPAASIAQLKSNYGDRLCLYPIWTGNAYEPKGKQVLDQLRLVAQCGVVVEAANIASKSAMDDYVHEVFYNFGRKEALDSDNDHVPDDQDKCMGTPIGATVNSQGCWVIQGIQFDTDKTDIKQEYRRLLDDVISVINRNPRLMIEVQGHTDNLATAKYNLKLSQQRAISVLSYLESHGVNKGVLTAKGYGLTQPVDTNATGIGRSNNRRVELKVLN